MVGIPLALALLFAAPQESAPPQQPEPTSQQRLEQAREKYEPARQAAIHVNGLAGNIRSESDARAFVDAVAEQFTQHEYLSWTTRGIRHRIAHAEYEAVVDPSRLIPEQRIVNIWNEYVRELDAPAETLVSVAELHNLRDALYTSNQSLWKRQGFTQSLWTIPNIYALDADGKVANGCRALEALRLLHDMFYFQSVRRARERVQKGVLVSDLASSVQQNAASRPTTARIEIKASRDPNPLMAAVNRYLQAHSQRDYRHLLERLFAELFPTE
jgi:hypothetical protein